MVIQRLNANACDVDVGIQVLASFDALPMLVWTVFGPDCIDYVIDDFGFGHGKKRRRGRFRGGRIINGAPFKKGFGWFYFKLGQLGQRAGWYFILIDASADFLINASSMAFAYQGCPVPGSAYANLGREEPDAVPTGGATWKPFGWNIVNNNIFIGGGAAVAIPAGYFYRSSISIQTQPFPGFDPPDELEVRISQITGGVVWQGGGEKDENGNIGFAGSVGLGSPISPATTLLCEYRGNNTPCKAVGSTWTVSGYDQDGLAGQACGYDLTP